MISVRKFLKEIQEKNSNKVDKENISNKEFNLEDFINGIKFSGSTEYIVCEKDEIEVNGFYYESVHEFFNHAYSIKLNGELLYSGYDEPGINEEFYIKGKYQSQQLAINEIKNFLKDKEFKIESKYERERISEG